MVLIKYQINIVKILGNYMWDETTIALGENEVLDTNSKVDNTTLEKLYIKVRTLNIEKDIITFRDFIQKIKDNYWGSRISNSLTLDLFAIYLNAQKILYIESKEHCENTLHWLMLPAIFITVASSVISISLKGYEFGGLIVAALTAFDTFLLSIISFTKLDAKAEAHKTSSYRFDKLQVKCQFYSGKVLLLGSVNDDITSEVKAFVETIEKQIDDIKDSNQFVIPAIIRYRYPTIYSVNIFSEVKRIKTEELGDSIFEVLIPTERVQEIKRGKKTEGVGPRYVIWDVDVEIIY
jgi:hypothetical protein